MKFKAFLRRNHRKASEVAPKEKDTAPEKEDATPLPPPSEDTKQRFVIECSSLDEYVASLLDLQNLRERHEGECLPVIKSADPSPLLYPGLQLRRVSFSSTPSYREMQGKEVSFLYGALLEKLDSASLRAESLCLLEPGSDSSLAALAHALVSGKRVASIRKDSLGSFDLNSVRVCTLVCLTDTLTTIGLDSIVRVFSKPTHGIPWGILTARDLSKLTWLIVKTHYQGTQEEIAGRIVHAHDSGFTMECSDALEVLVKPHLDPRDLESRHARPVPLGLYSGHGVHFCFASGLLCVANPQRENDSPKCIEGYQCVHLMKDHNTPILSTKDTMSAVVVLDSCFPGQLRFNKSEGLNVVTSLLEATPVGVIAPYRSNLLIPMQLYVTWAFLRAGFTIGEATLAVNRWRSQENAYIDPFVLFGDPEYQLFRPGNSFAVPIESSGFSSGAAYYDVPVRSEGVSLYDMELPPELAECSSLVLQCLISPQSASSCVLLQVLPGAEPQRVFVLAIWLQGAPREGIALALVEHEDRVEDSYLSALGVIRGYREALGEPPIGATGVEQPEEEPANGQSLYAELKGVEQQVASVFGKPVLMPAFSQSLGELADRIEDLTIAANRELLQKAIESHTYLLPTATYAASQGVRYYGEEFVDEECQRCRTGNVVRRTYSAGLADQQKRYIFECESCGFLCDIRKGMPMLVLNGPKEMLRSRVTEYEITGEFHGQRRAVGHASLHGRTSRSAAGFGEELFLVMPDCAELQLSPGEGFRIQFEVEPSGDIPAHYYRLRAFVVIGGELGIAFKWVDVCR